MKNTTIKVSKEEMHKEVIESMFELIESTMDNQTFQEHIDYSEDMSPEAREYMLNLQW